ncbi:hypothetical protein AZI09_01520 [Levilactobacillus brevis]|nr:hypothetical protein [Levilactobacillus brevis]ARN89327.1 hypothetical protein AZI09_01520 [Levilactobacillus brevis]
MANTKNSQAAKIRQQIITWLQDEHETEAVSAEKFPGIRGIRAVKLRQMLGALGFATTVVMGAVSAAPSIDHRIKKAALKPREVYYYFDASTATPEKKQPVTASTATVVPTVTSAFTSTGITAIPAFDVLQQTSQSLNQQIDDLLIAAQQQRPLRDLDINFLTEFAAQVTKQNELLQNFATQSKIDQLRHN